MYDIEIKMAMVSTRNKHLVYFLLNFFDYLVLGNVLAVVDY